jgi:hypothetical protein
MAQGQSGSPAVPASFFEIFKHAWPILFEKPKPLLVMLLAVALATLLVDQISDLLLVPYRPAMDALMSAQAQSPSPRAIEQFMETVASVGYGRWTLAQSLPLLAAPWLWLALCQAALNIWDGFQVGINNLRFAAKHYLTGLWIMGLTSLFGIFLFLFSTMCLLPLLLIQTLAGGGGASPGPNAILVLLGVAAGLFFFIRILWPHLRRFLPLQFMAYFLLSDGSRGGWAKRLFRLYDSLKAHGSHLNQAAAILAVSLLGVSVFSALIQFMMSAASLPPILTDLVGKLIVYLGLMWPLTALAGFHRLVLFPVEDQPDDR